jgi:hypothetical protein
VAHTPAVAFAVAVTLAIGSQTTTLDEPTARQFVRDLQREVARDDRAAVSARIRYPLTVFAGGVRIPIADAAALQQTYELIFSPALKALIADAALPPRGRSSSRNELLVSADAATIGVDSVRIEPVGGALKITRISAPTAATTSAAPPVEHAARANPKPGGRAQRLALSVGQVQRAGALAPGATDLYVVSAIKNQLLDVRITGVSGRDIVARIVSAKSRNPIDARARDGVRTWIGRVPENDDYRIEVVRLATGGAPRLDYILTVNIR